MVSWECKSSLAANATRLIGNLLTARDGCIKRAPVRAVSIDGIAFENRPAKKWIVIQENMSTTEIVRLTRDAIFPGPNCIRAIIAVIERWVKIACRVPTTGVASGKRFVAPIGNRNAAVTTEQFNSFFFLQHTEVARKTGVNKGTKSRWASQEQDIRN